MKTVLLLKGFLKTFLILELGELLLSRARKRSPSFVLECSSEVLEPLDKWNQRMGQDENCQSTDLQMGYTVGKGSGRISLAAE